MARSVLLCAQPWADVPLEELAQRAAEWGYQGLELTCWGDHLGVQRAVGEDAYCQEKLDLLARHDLSCPVISHFYPGQVIAGPVTSRHQQLLPDYVWGDGDPRGVGERAVEEMLTTIRAAQKLGAGVVTGGTGAPFGTAILCDPPPGSDELHSELQRFAEEWHPVLDVCRECGIRFAFELAPGQIAHDIASGEMVLDTFDSEELGFVFNPAPLYWQGLDPLEVLRHFPDRIYHVSIQDVTLTLNGRTSLLCNHLPLGDPRRGWDYRSPGHGGIDWEAIIRGLNEICYEGPLAVHWKDPGMDRDYGAEDACRFLQRLDFEPGPRTVEESPFQDA